MDNTIEFLLQQIMAKANENPDTKKKVEQSLESLLRHLQDIFFETTIEPIPAKSNTQTEDKKQIKYSGSKSDREKARTFLQQLADKYDHNFQQPDLLEFATTIGPKHGIFASRDQKRNKTLLALWLQDNIDTFKDDIAQFVTSLKNKNSDKTNN